MRSRIAKIQQAIFDAGLDCLLVANPVTLVYTMGFKTEADTYVLIFSSEYDQIPLIFAPELEFHLVRSKIDSCMYELFEPCPKGDFFLSIIQYMSVNGFSKLGLEFEYISHQNYMKIKSLMKKHFENSYSITNFSEKIKKMRESKDINELDSIQKASIIGMKGFMAIYDQIQIGMSENELAAIAEYAMKKAGSQHPSFNTLVQTGPNSAYPHGSTTDRKVQDGDFVLVDLGATFNGYCSDLTRTFIFGTQKSTKQRTMMDAVNETNQICRDAIKEGILWADLYHLSKKNLEKYDLAEYYMHSLGHGVGIEIHESPWLNQKYNKETDILAEGMVITIEPGVYIEGLGGVRTEDLLVVKKDGYENYSPLQYY